MLFQETDHLNLRAARCRGRGGGALVQRHKEHARERLTNFRLFYQNRGRGAVKRQGSLTIIKILRV